MPPTPQVFGHIVVARFAHDSDPCSSAVPVLPCHDAPLADDEQIELQRAEHGMPPMSGWGMGIDRFCALITNQENLRDVVLFPLMKPLDME